MYRPQLRIGAQEVMPVGAVGFGRVIDDLNHDERLFVGDRPAPERSEDLIMVEPNPAGIAQISGDAADLLAMPVALDHDPAQARVPHALDVIDRDPLRLFNKVLRHFCAMPMPPAPARWKGERGPDLAMEAASLIPTDMARPLRGEADPVEHPEEATACDEGDKAAVERDAKNLIRVIPQRGIAGQFRRAETGDGCGNVPAGPVRGKPVQTAPQNAASSCELPASRGGVRKKSAARPESAISVQFNTNPRLMLNPGRRY